MELYLVWVIVGVVLIGLEIVFPTFFLLFLGVAAFLVASIVAIKPLMLLSFQLFLFAVFSLISSFFWWYSLNPKLKQKEWKHVSIESAIGRVGMITEWSQENCRIKFDTPVLGDSNWTCFSDEKLAVGDQAVVEDIIGNKFKVKGVINQNVDT